MDKRQNDKMFQQRTFLHCYILMEDLKKKG